jgi:shikimate kinase
VLLGKEFFDSDAEIEKHTGVDIRFIFEKEGEARFREREREVIAALTALDGVIVATGGGAVLDPANRARLASTGTVIYLQASVDTQLMRTKPGRNRPLLMNADPRTVLERLMSIRQPLYEEIADIRVDTTGKRVHRRTERARVARGTTHSTWAALQIRATPQTFAAWKRSRCAWPGAARLFISARACRLTRRCMRAPRNKFSS